MGREEEAIVGIDGGRGRHGRVSERMPASDAIKGNVFRLAHGVIDRISWRHDAHYQSSSQAFCVSVWGSAIADTAIREKLRDLLADEALSAVLDAHFSLRFDWSDPELLGELGERRRAPMGALLEAQGLCAVIESRHADAFDSCPERGLGARCSGVYGPGSDLTGATQAWCRLDDAREQGSPRRYWPLMRRLSRGGSYLIGQPCPFSGPGFQVMRVVASAAAEGLQSARDWRAVLAFSTPPNDGVVGKLRQEHQRRVLPLDYRRLAEMLGASPERTARELAEFMRARL